MLFNVYFLYIILSYVGALCTVSTTFLIIIAIVCLRLYICSLINNKLCYSVIFSGDEMAVLYIYTVRCSSERPGNFRRRFTREITGAKST